MPHAANPSGGPVLRGPGPIPKSPSANTQVRRRWALCRCTGRATSHVRHGGHDGCFTCCLGASSGRSAPPRDWFHLGRDRFPGSALSPRPLARRPSADGALACRAGASPVLRGHHDVHLRAGLHAVALCDLDARDRELGLSRHRATSSRASGLGRIACGASRRGMITKKNGRSHERPFHLRVCRKSA